MSQISITILKSLHRIISQSRSEVKATKGLKLFHQESHIGRLANQHYVINATDRGKIIDWCYQNLAIDITTEPKTSNRITNAASRLNEKLGAKNVFANRVLVSQQQGSIQLKHGAITCLNNTCTQIHLEDICLKTNPKIIIVENGEAIINWHQMPIPEQLKSCLVIYRGHQQDSKALHQWLKYNQAKIHLIACVDIDPAGFTIAKQLRAKQMLVPADLVYNQEQILKQHTIKERFDLQITKNQHLTLKPTWVPTYTTLVKHRLAISQETIINKQIKLTLI